ncbi:MAG: DNA polymerase IV [Verrucomicrobiales bacterium]
MNSTKQCAHLDADAFFASVEQAASPKLRGRPIAVGGARRGIIASASYEARRFGVYTPMPTSRALKICPQLILVPGDYEKYERFSRFMFSFAYDFTPMVEIGSIDEGYFDLSGQNKFPATEILQRIRQYISQSLKISVSQGLGSNKLIAQIASKLHKPRALQCVPTGQEKAFIAPLDVAWLPSVGPKLAAKFHDAGLKQIEHVANTPLDRLSFLAGKQAAQLHEFAQGFDTRPIVPSEDGPEPLSYGHQDSFDSDTTDEFFLKRTLRCLIDKAITRLREDQKSARTLSVTIRYSDMQQTERSYSLDEPADLSENFYDLGWRLLKQAWERRVRLRMIRVKLSHIYNSPAFPPLLGAPEHFKHQALHNALVQVRARFGKNALMRGHEAFDN